MTHGFELEFTRPALLAGLIALPIIGYFYWRSLVDFARWQKRLSFAVRAIIVLLIVLALAGLTLLSPTTRQYVVFAIDRSLSVGKESAKQADEFIEQAVGHAGDHRVAFLDFAAEPGLVEGDQSQTTNLDDKGTDIAAALEVAAAAIPPFFVPKIVLLTDGNETDGDAVKSALSSGIPVHTIPLKTRDDPEVQVSAVEVPAQVAEGEPFNIEVVVDSNYEGEGSVEVFRGPYSLFDKPQSIKVKKGENRFKFQPPLVKERLAEYTVRIRDFKDTLLDNNSESGLVFISGKPRVLMIESDPKLARHLEWALQDEGIQVEIRPPQGMPDSLADLQNYELLLLSNVPATSLTMRQMEIARTYVQDLGGGLIMLGGDQSFGLGGYYKTVLEEILPVRSDFEKEKEKPSLAMVLVIDKSGSMGGDKIELAKDAAKGAVELLGNNDKIGVIAFEGETFWVSDIRPCSDKGYILDRISSIEAGGGTDMYPAMEEAYAALNTTVAKLKHVIILTDGISAPGDFNGISSSMAAARMTITTVGVGEGCDRNLLEEIANIGRGRFYFTNDPLSIPQIFAKETVTASKSAINEQPFLPQILRPSQVLSGIDLEGAPFLLGYVVTRPKPTGELILVSESGDPLLCWWRYGLGMTVAFTSDAKSRWAAEWLTWPGFGKFWSQLVRHAMRKSDSKGIMVSVDNQAEKTTVTVDAIEPSGKYLNRAETGLTLIRPDLSSESLPMHQTAPGRYQASFDTAKAGAYHLQISQKTGDRLVNQQSRGLVVGYPRELRLRPTNEELLQTVAKVLGGKYSPAPEEIFAATDQTALRATPLWPYLVTAAVLLLLADVALRRIDFDLVLGGISKKFSLVSGRAP